jgi:LacI family transcriptional regulator
MKINNKTTIYDMARILNVSVATVNRALNNKPKVSRETRDKVLRLAEELDYKSNKIAISLSRKIIKIGLVFESNISEFTDSFLKGVSYSFEELEDFRVNSDIYYTDNMIYTEKRKEIIDKLKEFKSQKYDGIILVLTPRLFQDISNEVDLNGMTLATASTDLPESGRVISVRHNGKVIGKLAAELLWWLTGGKSVAIFSGNREFIIHKEKIEAFIGELKEKPLDLVGVYDNQDDPDIAYQVTGNILKEYPDLGGIYVSSPNSIAVCKRIEEMGFSGKIKLITSDIFPKLKDYINNGTVQASIFQNPFEQGKTVVKCLYQHIIKEKVFKEEILINPQIIFKSNLELFL